MRSVPSGRSNNSGWLVGSASPRRLDLFLGAPRGDNEVLLLMPDGKLDREMVAIKKNPDCWVPSRDSCWPSSELLKALGKFKTPPCFSAKLMGGFELHYKAAEDTQALFSCTFLVQSGVERLPCSVSPSPGPHSFHIFCGSGDYHPFAKRPQRPLSRIRLGPIRSGFLVYPCDVTSSR